MMNTRLRRRLFLSTILGGGIVAAGAAFVVWPLSPEKRLKHLVRTKLHYLKISEEVLDAFVRDFAAHSAFQFRQLGTMKYAGQRTVYDQEFFASRSPIYRFDRLVIGAFLMSTDFFREGAKVDRPLSYVAYNDPYKLGCANQFARL